MRILFYLLQRRTKNLFVQVFLENVQETISFIDKSDYVFYQC